MRPITSAWHPDERLNFVPVCAAAAFLLVVSLWAGYQEARPFLFRGSPLGAKIARVTSWAQGPVSISTFNSRFARDARIRACLDMLRDARGVDSQADRRVLARGCLMIARATAARAPVSSNTWLVAAALAHSLREHDDAVRFLERSYATGSNAEWIVGRRAALAMRLRDRLPTALQPSVNSDFLTLFQTERGTKLLADMYVRDPAVRPTLAGLAENLPVDVQQRFLAQVSEAVRHREED